MQILSRMLVALGVIALIVGVGIFIYSEFEVWKQWIAISAARSRDFANPIPRTVLGGLIAVLGAFLAGLGISRSGRRRAGLLDSDQQRVGQRP